MPRHLVNCDGEMVTVSEYCRRKNISYSAVSHKKARTNMTYEEIFEYYEKGENEKIRPKQEYNGKMMSIREFCSLIGTDYHTVLKRIHKTGESLQEIAEYYSQKYVSGRPYLVDCDGEMVSIVEYCKRKGLCYSTVQSYKQKTQKPYEEVLAIYEAKAKSKEPIKEKPKVEYKGEMITLKTYCDIKGYSYNYLIQKAEKLNLEYLEVLKMYENGDIKSQCYVDCDGEKVSVKEYCKRKGLNEGTIKHFKCRHPNMTYEQIFKYYEENPIKQRAKNFRLHCIWKSMKDRCYNPKNPAYKNYGGKMPNPIKVCDRWLDYFNFEEDNLEEYLKQSEIYGETNVSIDRYNNDKWYMPSNCHWIPKYQQAWNKEGTHYFLPCNISLSYHCKVNNYNYNMVIYYIRKYNLSADEALAKWLERNK